eukprot:symbB.v1.2.030979.t2/scaffold3442.1/size104216/9
MRSLTFSVPVRKVARNFLPRLCLLPFHSKAVGGALVTRSSVMAHQHGGYPCPQFAPGRMISMPLVCCSGTDDRPRIAHSIPASPPLETKHAGNAMIRDQSPLVVCSPASPTLQARAIRGSNATIHDQYPAVICSPQSPQHQPRALRGPRLPQFNTHWEQVTRHKSWTRGWALRHYVYRLEGQCQLATPRLKQA